MENNNIQNVNEKEEAISLKDILLIIKKHIIAILAFIVVFSAGGLVFSKIQKPEYQSTASIYVEYQATDSKIGDEYNFSKYITETYVEFFSERVIFENTIEELSKDNIKLTQTALKKNLKISRKGSSLIIALSYSSDKAELSQKVLEAYIENAFGVANATDATGQPYYKMLKGNLSVLSTPEEGKKVSKTLKNVLIFLAIGVAVSFVYVLLREIFNNKFTSSSDIEKTLNLPVLGVIPRYIYNEETKQYEVSKKVITDPSKSHLHYQFINLEDPSSTIAEAYRRIRVSLEFTGVDNGSKVIQVCSPKQGDGKTTTALNLASTYAEVGKKVLIVDLDFRRPKVHRAFKVQNKDGITDVLQNKITLDEAIKEKNGMYCLPRGSEVSNIAVTLDSKSIANMFEELRKKFDIIIVDCPPVFIGNDAIIISKLCDSCVFIIGQDKSKKNESKSAVSILTNNQVNLVGCVYLNVSEKTNTPYYYNNYKYKYKE